MIEMREWTLLFIAIEWLLFILRLSFFFLFLLLVQERGNAFFFNNGGHRHLEELEAIGVKIENEDKALRLLWSLLTSYKHLLTILMYGKETVDLEKVISILLSEEKSLSGESTKTTDVSALAVVGNWKKNNSKKKGVYWGCGQSGHLKRDCHRRNGAGSANGSRSDTDSIASG